MMTGASCEQAWPAEPTETPESVSLYLAWWNSLREVTLETANEEMKHHFEDKRVRVDGFIPVAKHSAIYKEVMTMLAQYTCLSIAGKAVMEEAGVIPEATLQLMAKTLNSQNIYFTYRIILFEID